jgi:hypothetical protein
VLPEDGQSGLSCAIAWSGTLGPGQVHPFAGVSSDLAQHALQGFQKIVLSVRGDGGPVRLRLPTTAAHLGAHRNADQCTTDEDAYGFVFACGDGSAQWKTIEIPFDRLKQSGWGQVWTFDAADVSALQLQTERQKPGSFHCDFRLLRLEP